LFQIHGAGEGSELDLSGPFVHALNIAGPTLEVNGLTFTDYTSAEGVTVSPVQHFDLGYLPKFSTAVPGNEELGTLMRTHCWGEERPFELELKVNAGAAYQLQLIWWEGNSGFNQPGKRVISVSVDGTPLFQEFEIALKQGSTTGKPNSTCGVGMVHRFRAVGDKVKIQLSSSVQNPMLSGLTLEALESKAFFGNVQKVAPPLVAPPPGKLDDRLLADRGDANGQWSCYRLVLLAFHQKDLDLFRAHYAESIAQEILKGNLQREACWTESLAIGGKDFIEQVAASLKNRRQLETIEDESSAGRLILRETPDSPYGECTPRESS